MLRHRWGVVLFVGACGALNYTDRAAFGIAAPLFRRELSISPAELGILFSMFSVGYALFNFIGGYASDRFSAKRVFGIALLFWSIFCAAIAAATGFTSMMFVRILFGAAEGPTSSLLNKITSTWFTPEEAATPIGIGNAGNPLGAAVAGPIVGVLALHFGWRFAFLVFGCVGVIMAAIWFSFASEGPRRSAPAVDDATPSPPLGFYIRQPGILVTAFAFFAINYILYFFLSWFPSYLVSAQHLSISRMSLVTTIPWLLGIVGLAGGGLLLDFVARHVELLTSRKLVMGGFLALSAICVALAGLVSAVTDAVLLMSLAVLFMYLSAVVPWVIVQDLVHPSWIGSVSGFNHMLANIGGLLGPLLTGFIIQATGTYTGAFILAGGIGVAAAIAVVIVLRPIKPEPVMVAQHDAAAYY
jgi:ACS family hexuronate transporter-like MFS transporter